VLAGVGPRAIGLAATPSKYLTANLPHLTKLPLPIGYNGEPADKKAFTLSILTLAFSIV
jgi:hypothetical protein